MFLYSIQSRHCRKKQSRETKTLKPEQQANGKRRKKPFKFDKASPQTTAATMVLQKATSVFLFRFLRSIRSRFVLFLLSSLSLRFLFALVWLSSLSLFALFALPLSLCYLHPFRSLFALSGLFSLPSLSLRRVRSPFALFSLSFRSPRSLFVF